MSTSDVTTYYAVVREPGPAWDRGRSRPEQNGWTGHAAFMNALAETGFVVLGGPLGDGSRFLLIFDAASEQEIERRLADDPWTRSGHLTVTSAEPWQVLLDRQSSVQPRPGPA
jgi:uncharacterized protein YciI